MSKESRRKRRGPFVVSVGWVFADLLLALAMLFLVANTIRIPPRPTPTPIPSPTPTPTPSPTPNALILDPGQIRLSLTTNDPDGLSRGDATAMADLAQEIRSQITKLGLQSRRAGIAIAYGGAQNPNQIDRAIAIAGQVYNVLDSLGRQKFVFCKTLHYDKLYILYSNPNIIEIDLYMFNKSVGCDNVT